MSSPRAPIAPGPAVLLLDLYEQRQHARAEADEARRQARKAARQ